MRSYDYLKIKTKEEKRKRVYKTSQWQKWKNKVFIFAKISAIESQGKKKKKKECQEENLHATINTIAASSSCVELQRPDFMSLI